MARRRTTATDPPSGPDNALAREPSRVRLLRAIEAAGAATAAELVAATGLHPNTVRRRLDELQDAGRIRSTPDPPAGRGRPARRWRVVAPPRPYVELAATLADALASGLGASAAAAARKAGVAWGARLAAQHPGAEPAHDLVAGIMREQGFAPDPALRLHRCPLLELAKERPEIVCAVHEGMVEGIALARDAAARADLAPLAVTAGSACRLRLRTHR